jgi:hypothetical protein
MLFNGTPKYILIIPVSRTFGYSNDSNGSALAEDFTESKVKKA